MAPDVSLRSVLIVLGFLSAAAGAIHCAVIPEHLGEYRLFGVFFIVLGLGQLVWAMAMAAPIGRDWRLLAGGAVANLLVAALWLLARTNGLPIGPERWEPEPYGFADTLSAVCEVALAFGAFVVLRGSRIQLRRPVTMTVVAAALIFGTTAAALGNLGGDDMDMDMDMDDGMSFHSAPLT